MYRYIKTEVLLKQDTLSYQQILNLKRRMSGYSGRKNTTDGMPDKEWLIESSHTAKGLAWLYDKAFKPTHLAKVLKSKDFIDEDLRKNSPMGYRELIILLNFDHFTFNGFYHNCNSYQESMGLHFLAPLWKTYDKDGDSFEYYLNSGEMQIVG